MAKDERDMLGDVVRALALRRTFRKDGRAIELALLVREQDWRPLVAPWWHGKEASIIGADLEGNFFLRHCDGTVHYWQHRERSDRVVAKSVREFLQHVVE